MIAKPPHDRRLGYSFVSVTQQRINKKWMISSNKAKADLETLLLSSNYYDIAPFWWVTMIALLGLKNDFEPEYGQINKKYGDLPIEFELDVRDLVEAGADANRIYNLYMRAGLSALIHVGTKYDLPVEALKDELFKVETVITGEPPLRVV